MRGDRLEQLGGTGRVLRHTFCSRLAMAGAPAKAIQELAGHQHLTTPQRYMPLPYQMRTRCSGVR